MIYVIAGSTRDARGHINELIDWATLTGGDKPQRTGFRILTPDDTYRLHGLKITSSDEIWWCRTVHKFPNPVAILEFSDILNTRMDPNDPPKWKDLC